MDNGHPEYTNDKPEDEKNLNLEAFSTPVNTPSVDTGRIGNVAINGDPNQTWPVEPVEQTTIVGPAETLNQMETIGPITQAEVSQNTVPIDAPKLSPEHPAFEIIDNEAPQRQSSNTDSLIDLNLIMVDNRKNISRPTLKVLDRELKKFQKNSLSPAELVDLRSTASEAYNEKLGKAV